MQAFEVKLCGIRPCTVKCPDGEWSLKAKNFFKNLVATNEKKLYGKVNSFNFIGAILNIYISFVVTLVSGSFSLLCP